MTTPTGATYNAGVELVRRGFDESTRYLHFCVEFYSLEEACLALEAVGSYNGFEPERTMVALRSLNDRGFMPSFVDGICIGCEYSPVVYFTCDRSAAPTVMRSFVDAGADEVDYLPERGAVRAWWD